MKYFVSSVKSLAQVRLTAEYKEITAIKDFDEWLCLECVKVLKPFAEITGLLFNITIVDWNNNLTDKTGV